jgi:dienelactone hydrolase
MITRLICLLLVALALPKAASAETPEICKHVAERSRNAGGPIDVIWYDGATHGFDDPSASHQSIPGNRAASADALQRAINLIQAHRAN